MSTLLSNSPTAGSCCRGRRVFPLPSVGSPGRRQLWSQLGHTRAAVCYPRPTRTCQSAYLAPVSLAPTAACLFRGSYQIPLLHCRRAGVAAAAQHPTSLVRKRPLRCTLGLSLVLSALILLACIAAAAPPDSPVSVSLVQSQLTITIDCASSSTLCGRACPDPRIAFVGSRPKDSPPCLVWCVAPLPCSSCAAAVAAR